MFSSPLFLADEEMADTERFFDRAEEKIVRLVVNEVVAIRNLLEEESITREKVSVVDVLFYILNHLHTPCPISAGG